MQSLSQWQQRYPGKEWENQLNTFNQTIYMGCNDLTSAKYISEKCGKVTIAVTNNQMPMQPLFSPIYNSTRPYSKTRSNIQRDLMQPDEVLRLDQQRCLALFQGHRPALLYKLTPEELPDFAGLTTCRVVDYIPAWKQKAQETPTTAPRKEEKPPAEERTPAPQAEPPVSTEGDDDFTYEVDGNDLGMVELKPAPRKQAE